ncbi:MULTISPECIES: sirohydrochlorin chelatase [unclassified Gordonia (in: high G+C Gram-positive bacteria)]|uniref:sirohydrochlorin chelatase n=1 Tax=unclassified Gordonia (in: high G+C Gram-positive bacteria) TaxID=2657482 RepID=UPI0009AEE879|nr:MULTISPECIES: sirohydrochlorin chelatase [unclassified Gordonia (in: high G+C Gram-positive bacteria)]MDF3284356.1 sirohydrochlorin chelatase [Gordonia sp. N1V]OPX14173.1 cobalamin biosynthesis protein CbiX [Gordonia sp. i37]
MMIRNDIRSAVGDRLGGVRPVLVAHGTRNPRGVAVVAEIAEKVAATVGPTRTAFVDVLGPTPSEVLDGLDRPAVLVPAFLASGYHVRQDIPDHVRKSGVGDAIVTRALGPDPRIAAVLRRRLIESGWRPGDAVVLAAAGSSDDSACAQVYLAARQLEGLIGGHIEVGFLTTAAPTVADAVAAARTSGCRVVIAAYLLAPGLFHERLHTVDADLVAEPLGADPAIVELIVTRMRAAVSPYRTDAVLLR